MPQTIGDRVLRFRHSHHLDQRELAKLLGVDVCTIRNWERGRSHPHKKQLSLLNELMARLSDTHKDV